MKESRSFSISPIKNVVARQDVVGEIPLVFFYEAHVKQDFINIIELYILAILGELALVANHSKQWKSRASANALSPFLLILN